MVVALKYVWRLLPLLAVGTSATNSLLGLNVQRPEDTSIVAANVKVPVTLGVMSRCPDALLCESVFDKVLKQVGDKVDLSLTFIGK